MKGVTEILSFSASVKKILSHGCYPSQCLSSVLIGSVLILTFMDWSDLSLMFNSSESVHCCGPTEAVIYRSSLLWWLWLLSLFWYMTSDPEELNKIKHIFTCQVHNWWCHSSHKLVLQKYLFDLCLYMFIFFRKYWNLKQHAEHQRFECILCSFSVFILINLVYYSSLHYLFAFSVSDHLKKHLLFIFP